MPFEPKTRVHVLSQRSRDLDRDIFFFEPTGRLACGFNQRLALVTCAVFQRWIHLMDPDFGEFELYHATVRDAGMLNYGVTLDGPAISPQSPERLPPGDYAMVSKDPEFTSPFMFIRWNDSYAALKRYSEETQWPVASEDLTLYDIPPALGASPFLRDKRCFITGASSETTELEVFWIVPPLWNFDTAVVCVPTSNDHSSHMVATNLGLMRKDLIAAFHDNAFGIDVDDNYRIAIFRDFGPAMASLLPAGSTAHFRQARSQQPGPADEFLREHFRKCLTVYLPRGDIKEDYGINEIQKAVKELGLSDEDATIPPLGDERWNTFLGKYILEWYLDSLVGSDYYSDDSDDSPEAPVEDDKHL